MTLADGRILDDPCDGRHRFARARAYIVVYI